MSDWSDGYVTDVGYTYGYYAELNPIKTRLALLNSGYKFPDIGFACELGFGQGLSTNIHAAASDAKWFGDDFNPAQASFAQELAEISGNKASLSDEAFSVFAARTDLPDFDYIGLHGIWSWISDENRFIIVDFIKRKLKVGGVLYISYNTQPGWAAMMPMRDLLTEHSELMGALGQGIVSRIAGALEFSDKLFAVKPVYATVNPMVAEKLKKLHGQDKHYLAHEYFNQDWLPMPFAKMANWLSPAKLTYACSANYVDHVDAINLTGEQQKFLKDIPEVMFRQTVRDFIVNQQFRKDYWVKGLRTLSPLERAEQLRIQKVMLIQPRADVALKVGCDLGEVKMHEDIYVPILDCLADHQPKTLGQIEQILKGGNINLALITEAMLILSSTGALTTVQDNELIIRAKIVTEKLNLAIMIKSRSANELGYLASPVSGGGIPISRFDQLFILAIKSGKKLPKDWALFVWEILSSQGQRISKEGKTLETVEGNIAELSSQANVFLQKQLPILKALEIV